MVGSDGRGDAFFGRDSADGACALNLRRTSDLGGLDIVGPGVFVIPFMCPSLVKGSEGILAHEYASVKSSKPVYLAFEFRPGINPV